MRKLLVCSVGLIAALAANPAWGATDLMDVYSQARVADPQLRAAEYRLRADRELKDQARANFLPNISGSYGTDRGPIEESARGQTQDVDQDSSRWSVTLTQPLFDKEIWERRQQAGAQIEQAVAEYRSAEQQFVLRVAQRYFDVLSARDTLRFTRAEARALERQLDQAEQRFEVGLSAITDVHEARASYDDARARVIVSENDLDDAEEALEELTGQAMPPLKALQDELPLRGPDPEEPQQWVETALTNNPALEARQHAAEVADQEIDIARSGHYPTLEFQAQHSDFTDESNAAFSRSAVGQTYSVQLNVPIFSGLRVSSQTDQAGFNYSAALQDAEQEQRNVVRSTRDEYRAVLAGISEVEARRQALVSAQSALDATEAGFEVGTRTIVDVLISQQQLFQAQRDLAQARYNYLLSSLRLKQAAGVISAEDLQRINSLLVEQQEISESPAAARNNVSSSASRDQSN